MTVSFVAYQLFPERLTMARSNDCFVSHSFAPYLLTGEPSEEDVYSDVEAAYDYLIQEKKLYPEQIVLYGRSLGSGPSCHLAAKTAAMGRPVAGLILHSPFTSVYRVVFDFGFTVVGDKFSNIDRVAKTQCPVFIVHGQEDEIVPVVHG